MNGTHTHIHTLTSVVNRPTDKATWWGCGNHVPSIMDQVPENDRCQCEPKVIKEDKRYPPMGEKAD
jgi:hypothetical protein